METFSLADVVSVAPGGVQNPYAPPQPVQATIVPAPQADFALTDVVSVKPDADFALTDVVGVTEAPRVYTPDLIKATSAEELLNDKSFDPVQWGKANAEAVRQDPELLAKVVDLYKTRETRGTTLKEKLSGLTNIGPVLGAFKDAAIATGKASQNLSPQGLARPGGVDAAKQSAAEVAASVEAATAGSSDLIRRSARAVSEGIGSLPTPVKAALKYNPITGPGIAATEIVSGKGVKDALSLSASKSKADKTPEDWNRRFFDDVAGAEQADKAGAGNGAVMEALGVDAVTLEKDFDIKVDPAQIQALSTVTDPINYIPIGGAVGFVGKIGGKMTRGILATTGTAEKAAQLAATLNKATSAVGQTAGSVIGTVTEKVGSVIEKTGMAAEKGVRAVGGTASGLGLGGILGHDIYSALGGAAVAKGAPAVTKMVGSTIKAGGEMLTGARPVPGALALAGETAGKAITGAAKGTAEGALLTIPFELGARPDEEQFLMGAAGLGGVARGAIEGGAPVVKAAATGAQNQLAKTIFQRVEQTPAPDAGPYSTDPKLDAVHQASFETLQPTEKNLVNWGRELLRESGGEIYVVPADEFARQSGSRNGVGVAIDVGTKLAPDGTATPVFRIFLNEKSEALPHEFFHALEKLAPEKSKEFRDVVNETLTPEQRASFAQLYNSRINGGLPESKWTYRLTEDQITREVTAEVFSRLMLSQDLSGVPEKVTQKAATFVSGLLEKFGAPLGGMNLPKGDGVSNLGVRPNVEQVKAGREWLANMIKDVNENGTLGEPLKRTNPLESPDPDAPYKPPTPIPSDIVRPKPTPAPAGSTPPVPIVPATPSPAPTPTPAAPPSAPAPTPSATAPRNIRTTREKQNDFAAKRAEVTNIDKARAAAKGDAAIEAIVNDLAPHVESGTVVEIVHQGAISGGDASPRSVRRAEQEAAYIAEGLKNAPQPIREAYQKVFVPVRFEVVGGKPQLLAMSLDKVIANVHQIVKDAASKDVTAKIPYEIADGKLTDNGWGQVVDDLQSYTENQQNGYRGDGKKLVRPTTDVGLSIPAENAGYSPVTLSEERANFLNLVQALNPPLTAREVKAAVPGNVKGQILAEVNARTPETPSVIRPEDITKQEFKSQPGRSIKETNPLRNELAAAGVNVRELLEVTERINARDIKSVTPRGDINFKAPVTDTIRGGFLPSERVDFLPAGPNEAVRTVAEDYAKKAGIDYKPHTSYDELPTGLAKDLADFYEAAESKPNDPVVQASYASLVQETLAQLDALEAAGYTVEPWTGRGEPYKSSADAVADIRDNKHLFFLKTEGNINSAANNPMLAPWRDGLVVNDAFRAVHDFYGHGKEGYQFGPRGEFNAWKAHSTLFTPEAQGALAAETLAQNAWVNYGKHLRDENGNVPTKGKEGYVPPTERPFAEQKNILVPDSLISEAKKDFMPAEIDVAKTTEFADEVLGWNADEFNKRARLWEGGQRKKAYDLGLSVTSQEGVTKLLQAWQQASADRKRFMAEKNINEGVASALKAQFFREAHETATDTGGSAGEIGWRQVFPDREAPFPARELEKSFLPKDDEKNLVRRKSSGKKQDVTSAFKGAWEYPAETNLDDIVDPVAIRRNTSTTSGDSKSFGGAAWILPDGKVKSFKDASFHEQDLAANSADYNERFGTKFSKDASVEDRLDALNNGFVRVRNVPGRGTVVEASANRWGSLKPKVEKAVLANAGNTTMLHVTLLNKKGNEVASESLRLAGNRDREGAIKEMLNGLRGSTESSSRGPTDIQRMRALGGDFLPAETPLLDLGLPDETQAAQLRVKARVKKAAEKFPEALQPVYQKDENGFILGEDGKPKPVAQEYDLLNSPVGKAAAKGLKGKAREDAVAVALGKSLIKAAREAAKHKDIQAGVKWYSTARTRLKKLMGDDSKFFAELLGATSARTPVDINFRFALDAYNQFKAGKFDNILSKYREGKKLWETGNIAEFLDEVGKPAEEVTRGQFLDWWVKKHDLGPTQSNGKKFGANSRSVLRVLDGSWAQEVQGPKTPNFAGNLSGETFEATIDVWAARLLHRLANEGNDKRWRILPENETGVTDADFYMGQAAYRHAAEKLGMKPDALQAILWFYEKDHWEKNGWTRGAGAEKSDFNTLLADTDRDEASGAMKIRTAQKGFDFNLTNDDIKPRGAK